MANRLNKAVQFVYKMPKAWHSFLLTKLFNTQVKYAGTSKIKLLKVSEEEAILTIPNKKPIQNHIGGVHACAAALLAESTTGIVVGVNLPDDKIPLIKSMTIKYKKRMQGGLIAKATLSPAYIARMKNEEKGDFIVPINIVDESGEEPIEALMEWAWISKKK
ncbi:DUF4442 domain-containing protein [Thalassotalea agarivorans]|uniref:Acyl-coenzyme A thioesterase PaaI, contains HGG motif n=1 Tax=Thalassotalea agarivorans TaxID=349064 RepID=A0A1I0HRD0_THASX|nr:DUF4442 domain-containing protein [Thalassotalea agarivorans]SET85853.1 Acyl-coenzyme A thioesterase PaaI, contains HGG motif [Thalassotalea agarivorans]